MASSKRYRTEIMRVDPEMKMLVNKIISEHKQKNKKMTSSRVTKAMVNQYKKYGYVLNELKTTDLSK